MAKFNLSLTACSFHLKRIYSKGTKDIYYLNDVIPVKSDVIDIITMFKNFVSHYSIFKDDEFKQKTFHCEISADCCGETDDFRYFYMIIKSGSYGSSSEIIDRKTHRVSHHKKKDETDERPFILYIVVPKDSHNVKVQKGMFFFQNVGIYGVKTITIDYIKEFFSQKFGVTLICKAVAPELFIKKMISESSIDRIVMTKNVKSEDISDNQGMGYGQETRVLSKLIFGSKWPNMFEKIKFFSKAKYNLFEFGGVNYDGLKLIVNVGDRQRTIDMGNLENLSLRENIPEEVKMPNGHPNINRLLNYFHQVGYEYLSEMVLEIK